MSKYLDLAKDVVQRASGDGLEIEVFINESKNTQIRVAQGEVEQLSQSGSRGMGVRVIKNGQTGYAYTSDFSDEGINQTWQTAIELAEVATSDEFRKLPEPQPIPDEDLDIWDENLANITVEQKIEKAKQIEQTALNYDERIIMTNRCTYGDSITHVYLANSKGFVGEYARTTITGVILVIAGDLEGDKMNAFGFQAANHFDEFDSQKIGEDAARKALSILGGKPVPTQKGTVVFDQVVAAQVMGALSQALMAESWQKNRSFLMGKMGETVGSDKVTLMDNGRMKGGLASAPFDGEGVPTSATRLIDEGVLQNLIYDSYSAARDNVGSTGNAQRAGHRSTPGAGPSNFYMQPGHKSREEIIKGVDKGLYVISAMQTGGINPINGDCSMSANGLWIENGEIVGPVNGVTVATTLNDFLSNLSEVGNDLAMIPFFGNIGVPTLRIDDVTIGGVEEAVS